MVEGLLSRELPRLVSTTPCPPWATRTTADLLPFKAELIHPAHQDVRCPGRMAAAAPLCRMKLEVCGSWGYKHLFTNDLFKPFRTFLHYFGDKYSITAQQVQYKINCTMSQNQMCSIKVTFFIKQYINRVSP